MNKTNLEVYTLGRFLVKKDDNLISDENSYANKLWELFQYLLSNMNKVQPIETIIDDLEFDLEMLDARNALENRIYRLRKLLAKNEKYKAEKYIIFKQGGYALNGDLDFWCDIKEFRNRCRKGEEFAINGDKESALNEYLPALKLYKGDYLNNRANNHWAVAPRIQYKQMYLDSLNKTVYLLEENKEFMQIEELCREAIQYEPFEERPHYLLINNLLKLGHKREAKRHYDFVKSLFADQVDDPFPNLSKELYQGNIHSTTKKDLKNKRQGIYNIDKIKEELKLKNKVSDHKFIPSEICYDFTEFLVKNQQRNNGNVYIVSIALEFNDDDIEDEEKNKHIKYLTEKIIATIRSSDLICEWSSTIFSFFNHYRRE